MAFTAGKSKEIEGKSNDWLLDQSLMQSMQDRFCDANNVYMVCLNAQNGVVTKAYGTKEELEYVYSKAGRERHVSLLDKMTGHSIESVVEEPLDTDFIKMSGVAIHVSGETIAVWIVIGIMDDSTEDIPDYMMRTSPERYYKSLEFLESLSKQIFAVKMEEVLAQEAFNKSRESKWYAEADFADLLVEDYNIRTYLKKKLYAAGVSKIEIERASDRVKIIIYTAKPGVVIGKGGAEIEKIKAEVQKFTSKKLVVDIKEVKRPDRDAQLVAENIALQLENRVSFRRAMKSCMSRTMKSGAKGIKTSCSGRLGGADMARTEFYSEGTIPLQTLRADIDYGFAEADTTYGKVGVKVWIYKGEVLPTKANKEGGAQ